MQRNRMTHKGLSRRVLYVVALLGLLLSLGIASPSTSQTMIKVIV